LTLPINRREFGAASAALAVAVFGGVTLPPRMARADAISPTALMKPQALPDMVLGSDKAPVTVVEYASMTCPHCAHFAEKTFPVVKKDYIDTGKVRWILREFPLDSLAAAAFMLARCAGETDKNRYYAMVDTLFKKQLDWAVERPIPHLKAIAKQAGFTEDSFKACLTNQKLLDGIEKERETAISEYKVHSTPTFFINGTVYEGAFEPQDIGKIIDPHLKGG
jgi:protein-disulfide isomerase